ncbi:hypothetical protein N7486_007759 [Penicillium sp. IBT 16267x]|nr:hypothetical protein N7486_007759 [Penicillium sp. IBT 16267x]
MTRGSNLLYQVCGSRYFVVVMKRLIVPVANSLNKASSLHLSHSRSSDHLESARHNCRERAQGDDVVTTTSVQSVEPSRSVDIMRLDPSTALDRAHRMPLSRPLSRQGHSPHSSPDNLPADNSVPCTHEDYATLIPFEEEQVYAGVSSEMSIFSEKSLQWIARNTVDSIDSLLEIRAAFPRHFIFSQLDQTLQSGLFKDRPLYPLPSQEVAEKYIEGYFGRIDWGLPVLSRSEFDQFLVKFRASPPTLSCSWYTLYNVVLASGCRAIKMAADGESPVSFRESQAESLEYFRNALSVHAQILYEKTDLAAVQALTIMTLYVQGIACPQIESMLSAVAVRLAMVKGLHKAPCKGWNLSSREVAERDRTFGVLYWLDKTIALRSGRPQLIDDSEISCKIVTDPEGVTTDRSVREVEMSEQERIFVHNVQFAVICSQIKRQIYSALSLARHPRELFPIIQTLERELNEWYRSTPIAYRIAHPVPVSSFSMREEFRQALAFQFMYQHARISIHGRIMKSYHLDREDLVQPLGSLSTDRESVENSIHACVDAARSVVLLTRYIDMDNYTPSWVLFYYPFTALTYLFMHVVGEPLGLSAHDDMALIDVVIGLFARLEFVSSGIMVIPKVGAFSRIARDVVAQAERALGAGFDDLSLRRSGNQGGHFRLGSVVSRSASGPKNLDGTSTDIFAIRSPPGDQLSADYPMDNVHHMGRRGPGDNGLDSTGMLPLAQDLFQSSSCQHVQQHNSARVGHQREEASGAILPATPDMSDVLGFQNFDWSLMFSDIFRSDATY